MLVDKLKRITELCKNSISIQINDHKGYYITARQEIIKRDDWYSQTPIEVIEQMILTDTIISIQCYPRTPVSFYIINHYDLELALDEMLKILENENRNN